MLVEELVVRMIEQAPSLAIMVWLVYSLRQDVKFLTETLVTLQSHLIDEKTI